MGASETGSGQICSRTNATRRRGLATGIRKEGPRENCLDRRKATPSPKIITCVNAKKEGAVPPKAKIATHTAPMRPASRNRTKEGSRWINRRLFDGVADGDVSVRTCLVADRCDWNRTRHSCHSR